MKNRGFRSFLFLHSLFVSKKNGVRKRKRGFIIFPEELGAKQLLCFVTLNYAWIWLSFLMIFKAIMMEFCDKPKECLRWGQYPRVFFFHFIFSKIRSVRIKYWMSLCTNICNRFFSSCIIIWKLWVRKFVMWHPCDKNYWNLWKRVYKNTNLKGCER